MRLSNNEARSAAAALRSLGVSLSDADPNVHSSNGTAPVAPRHRAHVLRRVLEMARSWPLYFARLFIVDGAPQVIVCLFSIYYVWGKGLPFPLTIQSCECKGNNWTINGDGKLFIHAII